MSRASSRHIRRLEDAVRDAIRELTKTLTYAAHVHVSEVGNPNCQCGSCRALRGLQAVTLRRVDH
jgi:hypothetical protein